MGAANSTNLEILTTEQLNEALAEPGAVVVDLRLEFERYHRVAGAVHAPWDREAKHMPTDALPADKDALLIVHCASGNRVRDAIPFLAALGYRRMVNGGGPGRYPVPDAPPAAPPALWACYAARRLIFQQLFDDLGSSTFTYLLGCPTSGEALLIDPVVEHVERDM